VVPGVELVYNSIAKQEVSGALLGTPTLWVFKSLIVLCFTQLLAIGVYVSWKNLRFLRGRESAPYPPARSVREAWESDANQ
jgi:TRAP-type mannitol/chloroaromatic compound transport system permease small subunit